LRIFEGFSPNNDFLNETWRISGIEWYPDNMVRIYNQGGELVFESARYDNESIVWDGYGNYGRYTGSQLPEGSYTYVIKLDATTTRKGIVVIAR
jgi:gliding motility-associated-like protein